MKKLSRSGLKALYPVMILALLIGLLAACKGKSPEEAVRRPVVDGVKIVVVAPSVVDEVYETTGNVRSDRESLVASRVMGVVTSVLVQEGDAVKAGQLLLTIDDRDASQRAQAAGMALESAKQNKLLSETTWRRYKNLYDEKALSRQEMDQVETQKNVAQSEYERAKAMADEARTHQSFTRVKSPVSGRVTQKRIEAGSMASPGMPLLVIEESGSFYVEAAVDERLRDKIKAGMEAELLADSAGLSQRTTVRQVLTSIDPLSRTFVIKIDPGSLAARSGLFVRVRIPVGKKEALAVSSGAIVQKGQLTGVYAVDDHRGTVTYRLIRTGPSYAGHTEVLSGLVAGDRVITEGVERAQDGGVIAGGNPK